MKLLAPLHDMVGWPADRLHPEQPRWVGCFPGSAVLASTTKTAQLPSSICSPKQPSVAYPEEFSRFSKLHRHRPGHWLPSDLWIVFPQRS
jgi:hypothetical protein